MIRRSSAALALFAFLSALACDDTQRRERQSAANVARAEEALRNADNSAKLRALGLLSEPCFGKMPCEVQRACRSAYALYIDGLQLTQAARQQLDDGQSAEAAKLLGAAEEKLTQARSQVADCTDQAAELRRHYVR